MGENRTSKLVYRKHGHTFHERCFVDGYHHNDNGPAVILYHLNYIPMCHLNLKSYCVLWQ